MGIYIILGVQVIVLVGLVLVISHILSLNTKINRMRSMIDCIEVVANSAFVISKTLVENRSDDVVHKKEMYGG